MPEAVTKFGAVVSPINKKALTRWLEKAERIQWAAKNSMKPKGVLKRLK